MARQPETPFDSIEGAHEYVGLLVDAIADAQRQIAEDLESTSSGADTDRRVDALRLVAYKLKQLQTHMSSSSRLLNDLRTLRRLLLAERPGAATDFDEPPGS